MTFPERRKLNRQVLCVLCAIAYLSLMAATLLPVLGMLVGWPSLGEAVAVSQGAIMPAKKLVAYEGMYAVHGDQLMGYLLLPPTFGYGGAVFATMALME